MPIDEPTPTPDIPDGGGGGNPNPPTGELLDSFPNPEGGAPIDVYFVTTGGQRNIVPYSGGRTLPAGVTVAQRGRADGALLATRVLNGITYLIFSRTTLPFAVVVTDQPVPKLVLDFARATNETPAGDDGTATIQASGGVAPLKALLVDLGRSQSAMSGEPNTFPDLSASVYTLRITDSSKPVPQQVEAKVTVGVYKPPVSDVYTLAWRSAWGPGSVAVRVPAEPGQVEAYVAAELRIGFREGHPLNVLRPLGEPVALRATIAPDGYATFKLGPYLRAQLGASDGLGGYRLDINEESVDDFYVGYELRRAVTGELLDSGYAVNSAMPDEALTTGLVLSSFVRVPAWPGFSWKRARLASRSGGQYGAIDEVRPTEVYLRCPANPLPVAWLNPLGGWDFWVFQGRPQLGDEVGDSQSYTEAGTGQRRYSQRGESRATITGSSGAFSGADLAEGLRTLWASPQVWYQPVAEGEWVPVTLEGGSFPVRRMGVGRIEVSISFTEARPHYAQGQ
jgi:hypothetical protein